MENEKREWSPYQTLKLLSVYKHETGIDIFVKLGGEDVVHYPASATWSGVSTNTVTHKVGVKLVYKDHEREVSFPAWRFETLLGTIYILQEIDRLGDELIQEVHGIPTY